MPFKVGDIVDGKITGLTKFGAFVSIPDGKSGMVHISEISTDYVKEITDHLSEGQKVRVKFLGTDEKGRISLSIRQAAAPAIKTSSFEDMMSKFKQESNENILALKRSVEGKRGGFSKRGR